MLLVRPSLSNNDFVDFALADPLMMLLSKIRTSAFVSPRVPSSEQIRHSANSGWFHPELASKTIPSVFSAFPESQRAQYHQRFRVQRRARYADRRLVQSGHGCQHAAGPVRSPFGVCSSVSRTTCSTFSSPISRGAPGRGSSPSPTTPSAIFVNRAGLVRPVFDKSCLIHPYPDAERI